jgi:hypothetical protein
LESEINQAISVQAEQKQEESQETERFDYGLSKTLGVSGVVNSVFLFLSKDWDESDRQKLVLDEMESRNFDEMVTPYLFKIAEKLGLAISEISALVALAGLLLPRVFTFASLSSKYSKKQKRVEYKKEESSKEESSKEESSKDNMVSN